MLEDVLLDELLKRCCENIDEEGFFEKLADLFIVVDDSGEEFANV